jgi:hypothetical protein
VAAVSTDAAANGLDTNTELCGNGSQANSAGFVGGADGRTPRGMDGRPTNWLVALGTLGLGPRHAGHHALADDRALELSEDAEHLKHRVAGRRRGVEALLMQVQFATLRESRSSFVAGKGGLALLGQRHRGGQLRPVAALAERQRTISSAITVIYAAEKRHVLLTTEKIRALVYNIRDKKDRDIESEVVKKDDDDG